MKKRALISVSDKDGIVEFARGINELGFEIISTGGTAAVLKEAGLDIVSAEQVTGFPECLDGRVKTMHPNIHAGILAMRSNKDHMAQLEKLGVVPIDIVVINLYPFKMTIQNKDVTLSEAIENIDIGGPTALRAAAKNWQDVAVITDPSDYSLVLAELKGGKVSAKTKQYLSYKVFEHTAHYDAMIANFLRKKVGVTDYEDTITLTYEKVQDMRYGENPHQTAAFYKEVVGIGGTISGAEQLQGKELSFNNINDADAALTLVRSFDRPSVVAVKHANPCGVASGENLLGAYQGAYNSDPVSIYGGIVAVNRELGADVASKLIEIFLEVIISPSYTDEALEIFKTKPNLRILKLDFNQSYDGIDLKKVGGGILVQQRDCKEVGELKVVTKRKPTQKEMDDLLFAWKVVKHVKSNGICLVKDSATIGIGPGQTNRITALNIAVNYAGAKAKDACLASDAYFPFADNVQAAADAGVTAIIQPGGSIRDEDSIRLCDEKGIAMVFTGIRHFKH